MKRSPQLGCEVSWAERSWKSWRCPNNSAKVEVVTSSLHSQQIHAKLQFVVNKYDIWPSSINKSSYSIPNNKTSTKHPKKFSITKMFSETKPSYVSYTIQSLFFFFFLSLSRNSFQSVSALGFLLISKGATKRSSSSGLGPALRHHLPTGRVDNWEVWKSRWKQLNEIEQIIC